MIGRMNNVNQDSRLVIRDWMAIILFALIVFLMGFLQYMQYTNVDSKRLKNIVVFIICAISIVASVSRRRFMLIDRFIVSIYIFLVFILISEILNNRFSVEYYYYSSVSFLTLIGGYSFANSYSKYKVERIIKISLIPIYAVLAGMFITNFLKLGFASAGIQTSIVYPLMFFVLIGCFYGNNVTLLCSIPMLYGGLLLMARSVLLLTIAVIIIKLLKSQNTMESFLKKFFIIVTLGIVVFFLFQYVLSSSGSNILMKAQLRGGDFSSGRNDIYISSLKYFFNCGPLHMLIGSGFNTATRLFGISAHSDFIQFLLNYGVVGMIWYTQIQLTCIKKTKEYNPHSIVLIEVAVLILYITINQFFLAVGPSTLWGFVIGMYAGRDEEFNMGDNV